MHRLIGSLVILLSFAGGWTWMDYRIFPQRAVLNRAPVVFEIAPGEGVKVIAQRLHRQGITDRPLWFLLRAHLGGVAAKLKFGEYEIPGGLTQAQLLDLLASGKVKHYAVTVPEGWRYAQFRELLSRTAVQGSDGAEITDAELMSELGMPGQSPEGWFYPDTYFYAKGMSPLDLLRRAHRKMRSRLEQEWTQRQPGLPLTTPYEALILASIVEKETARGEERPRIAGVFLRRLDKGMPLQTDPTVIYGMGVDYRGNIRREDLLRDTPYNTYVRRGLPPTPIALPGEEAIRAVLHPEPGESLYFVARGDGSHVFSNSLDEHNRAVEQYQLHRP